MNKTIPLILFIFFLCGFIHTGPIHAVTLSSRDIIIDVDNDSGRINLSAVAHGGDIDGIEGVNLLFYDRPPSSYTVIYLNGDFVTFGGDIGRFTRRPVIENNAIGSVWEHDAISVIQQVQFVERRDTGAQDGVLISYLIENKSAKAIKVGLRVLFDTYLGERDIHHFILSGDQQVRYEAIFEEQNLPQYWVSKGKDESLVCLRGLLKGELVTTPDKVIFANYRALREEPFDYEVKRKKKFDLLPYSKNDSAVALLYRPVSLKPGASREYCTILGLCRSGEYSLIGKPHSQEKKQEIVKKEEAVKTEEFTPTLDRDAVVNEFESIQWERGTLGRINELIDKLNIAIEDRGKTLSEDDIIRMRNEFTTLLKRE
jgi:hypothetical protein